MSRRADLATCQPGSGREQPKCGTRPSVARIAHPDREGGCTLWEDVWPATRPPVIHRFFSREDVFLGAAAYGPGGCAMSATAAFSTISIDISPLGHLSFAGWLTPEFDRPSKALDFPCFLPLTGRLAGGGA